VEHDYLSCASSTWRIKFTLPHRQEKLGTTTCAYLCRIKTGTAGTMEVSAMEGQRPHAGATIQVPALPREVEGQNP
jgi:hypothetical protein